MSDVALDELSTGNLWEPYKSPRGDSLSPEGGGALRDHFSECDLCDIWGWMCRFVMRSSQPTYRCRDPEHVRVAWVSGVSTGDLCDALEPIPNGIWMNKQLPCAGFDGSATVEIRIEGVGKSRTRRRQWNDHVIDRSTPISPHCR